MKTRVKSALLSHRPAGSVQVHVGVRVEMAELVRWEPEKMKAFLDGVGQCMAAMADQR